MIDMEADLIHRDFLLRESRFTELKGGFIEISSRHITKLILESLKEFYSGIIDSKRDKDHVKNIEGLLRILERREVLRYDLIEPLKVIASKYIKDEILNRRLADYEEKLKNEGPLLAINHYRYRGEYSEQDQTSEIEYLLNNHHNYNGLDHMLDNKNTDPHVERIRTEFEKTEEQLLIQQINVKANELSGSNNSMSHLPRVHYLFNARKWGRKSFLMTILSTFLLIFIVMICINLINGLSSAVERSSPSASRNKISQSHAVNFYDTAQTTLPAVIYPSTLSVARTTSHSAPDIQEKVFRRVCENLGKFWRDLARFLGVKENEIDIIDAKSHLEIKEKAYEALLIFKSRCDSCNWKIKMQNALVKARRKDLAEMINEIDDR
ncbi:uncharacterized protein Fadd isoform X1 [Fopius arisanus]|uniref:BG4_0 protein n=1 Tax=Fopius arisanus TaxID=64838 RepID=A0A0C9QWH0_9HYME|nr:PREDICTED: uncharacterized protein LOC105266918 isoform X1 [Fopius arisanus]